MNSSLVPLDRVIDLVAVYGGSSQAGFGTAVFSDIVEPGSNLEPVALWFYQYFVGTLWERYGEATWMNFWKQIYVRPSEIQLDILAELRAIADPIAANAVPLLLLDETDDGAKAQQALAGVFDDPQMTDLSLYAIGDGAALSGLLLIGCHPTGEATILIFLLD